MKNRKQVVTFFNLIHFYGLYKGCLLFILRYTNRDKYYLKLERDLESRLKKYIKKINIEIEKMPLSKIGSTNKVIWFLWYQGKEKMPPVVRKNFEQLLNITKKSEYKVIFLDKKNILNYLNIPEYILKKVDKKEITLTHFSDIIRAGLLYNYGGIWLDSTCYVVTNNFDSLNNYDFYTQKYRPGKSSFFNKGKWSGFFMASGKRNPFEYYLYSMFLDYWKNYNCLVDYFLIDIFIEMGYKNNNLIKSIIDAVPYNNSDIMSDQESSGSITKKSIAPDTWIIKLDWRKK